MRRLPTFIQIAGQTITIKQVPDLYERDGVHGDWDSKSNLIRIQSPCREHPRDTVLATYYHELFHAVLDLSGHTEWSKNEDFVERVGQLLYQARKTESYGKEAPCNS